MLIDVVASPPTRAFQILRVASKKCKSKAKRSGSTLGMISALGSPTLLECVRVLMGEGVQGLSFWAGYMCINEDWVQKRCRDKTGVTSKRARHFSCALAVLSEQQGSVACCPRRTSSLVSCTASQSRLAHHFRFLSATETRLTRMPNGIAQLQLPVYASTRWLRNSRQVWRRIISQVGIQLFLFGIRSRNYSLEVSTGIVKYPIFPVSSFHFSSRRFHCHSAYQRCGRRTSLASSSTVYKSGTVESSRIAALTEPLCVVGLCTVRFCKDSDTATVTNALSALEASVSMHPWRCSLQ